MPVVGHNKLRWLVSENPSIRVDENWCPLTLRSLFYHCATMLLLVDQPFCYLLVPLEPKGKRMFGFMASGLRSRLVILRKAG